MRTFPGCWNRTLAALGYKRKARKRATTEAYYRRHSLFESLEPRQMLSVTVTTDTGRVLNAEGDGQVQLIDRATNAIVARARLRADGMAEFRSVPPGDYTLAASVPGLELRGEAAVSVAPTAPSTAPKALTLRLRRVR